MVAIAAAMILTACAPQAPPGPITLRFPDNDREVADPRRALAERLAGTFVGVAIRANTEIDGEIAAGTISGASGIIVDARGYVVTAAHIARNTAFDAEVTTVDGVSRPAEIVDVAPDRELALLRIEPFAGMVVATLSDGTREGAPVLSIGAPGNCPGAVALGTVANPRWALRVQYGDFGFDDAVVLRMDVSPGHSGGAVFSDRGRLIGMIASFGLGDTRQVPYVPTGIAYAVPARAIARYLNEVVPRAPAATRR